jgi:uncharacterized protein
VLSILAIVVALLVGGAVGVVVGMLGAGGSVITVPALMLLLGLSATEATGTSLVVVALIAGVGLITHARAARVDWRSGLGFAAAGLPASAAGGYLAVLLDDVVLTLLLVGLLLASAVWMWSRRPPAPGGPPRSWTRILPVGAGVGLLTGTLGVGGGFVAVPALAAIGLPLPVAIGTSQLVLVVNAVAGLAGRLGTGAVQPLVGVVVAVGGGAGALLASRIVGRVDGRVLTRAFAGLLVVASAAMVLDLVLGA